MLKEAPLPAGGAYGIRGEPAHVWGIYPAQWQPKLAPPGCVLTEEYGSDGGNCVITCATTVNQTGNNTITLDDAGDAILLVAKANGSNKRWSVVSNDGCTLSTV